MKNFFIFMAVVFAFLSAILSWGTGLTVANGMIMIVMYSADWFSLIFTQLTVLSVLSALLSALIFEG